MPPPPAPWLPKQTAAGDGEGIWDTHHLVWLASVGVGIGHLLRQVCLSVSTMSGAGCLISTQRAGRDMDLPLGGVPPTWFGYTWPRIGLGLTKTRSLPRKVRQGLDFGGGGAWRVHNTRIERWPRAGAQGWNIHRPKGT